MSNQPQNKCDKLDRRKALLDSLGGLPEGVVENSEWLYMLEEETRHSLSIEGHFATEQDLKAVLEGRKTAPEMLNYHRTAQSVYDLALQQRREDTLRLDMAVVRHIHSELFRALSARRGEFRLGAIRIQGAGVQPPAFDVESYIRAWMHLSHDLLETLPLIAALARLHALFESIHPFEDGNGRDGRILMNYLAISKGYPAIVIKGFTKEDRTRYYGSLEAADSGFHRGFPEAEPAALRQRLDEGQFEPIEQLFCEGMLPRLDRIIVTAQARQEPLAELKGLAAQLGVQESTLRQWVHRGKLLAIKRGKKLYSHARLVLLN
jgi:Fic family protein